MTDAGATVAASVVLTDKWGALASRQRAALSPLAPDSDAATQDKALLAALAAALTAGAEGDATLEALQGQNLITKSGDLSLPCTFFVLVGGKSDDTPSPALDGLLDGFKESQPTSRWSAVSRPGPPPRPCRPFRMPASPPWTA